MKDNRKEFIFVIGKSEGMNKEKVLEGFNKIVQEQKTIKDESIFTLVFFNDDIKIPYNGQKMKNMRKYTDRTYVPKGRSALWDAMGTAMDTVGERLSNTPDYEMPCQVVMIVIGEKDNASTVYDYERLERMVNEQKYIYKWEFILYSDDNTLFGINKGGTLEDYDKMFDAVNKYITNLR